MAISRLKRGRLRRPLPLVMPLSPETKGAKATIWYNNETWGGFVTEGPETVQRIAADRIAGFDRAMTREFQYRDYDLFQKRGRANGGTLAQPVRKRAVPKEF